MSQNVQGGLFPTSSDESLAKAKLFRILDCLDDGVDVISLQETGVHADSASSFPLEDLRDHHLLLAGADGPQSVGLAVHRKWDVRKVYRLPGSSRCIGASVVRGSQEVFVASIHLPPGLDRCPRGDPFPSPADGLSTRESKSDRLKAMSWAEDFPHAFLMVDFDCTPVVWLLE